MLMQSTTKKLHQNTKSQLDSFREYKNESYDEVVQKVVYIAKNADKKPELSKEVINAIEKARARIKKGRFLTEEEAKKTLYFALLDYSTAKRDLQSGSSPSWRQ